jgi:hypothetical protein
MPTVTLCPSVEEFHRTAGAWLAQKEAQNNLILGVLSNLLSKPVGQRQEHHFWTVEEEGTLVGAAFWTPPYKLTLSEMDKPSLIALADSLKVAHPQVPGVQGPKDPAKHFSHFWNLKTGRPSLLETSMRIYQLDQVEGVPANPGLMRLAAVEDTDKLVEWTEGLNRDAELNDPMDPRKIVEGYIREQRLFLWTDGEDRAMAGYGRSTPNSLSVNMVYTPPAFRRQGYATSLVAELSRKILSMGKKHCFLFTDLLNPTSNNIYQKIGYQPMHDWNAYQFK